MQGLSGFAGDFVVATAGPDLESIIAAKGAGIHTYAKDQSVKIVNFDIGGGTSNLAVIERGNVTDTGCLDIGGRLIKMNRDTKKIEYISPKIKDLINDFGWNIQIGQTASRELLQPVVDKMVELLEESAGVRPAVRSWKKLSPIKESGIWKILPIFLLPAVWRKQFTSLLKETCSNTGTLASCSGKPLKIQHWQNISD